MKKPLILGIASVLLTCCNNSSTRLWTPLTFGPCTPYESQPTLYAVDHEKLKKFDSEVLQKIDYPQGIASLRYCEALDGTRGILIAEVGKGGTGIFRYDRQNGSIEQATFLSGSILNFIPADESFFLDEPNATNYRHLKQQEIPTEAVRIDDPSSGTGTVDVLVFSRLLFPLRTIKNDLPIPLDPAKRAVCLASIQNGCLVDLVYGYDYVQNRLWLKQACTSMLGDGVKYANSCSDFPKPGDGIMR